MEGIETLALFEEKVSVTPRDLANHKLNIHSLLLTKLAERMEGKCSLHGWVVPQSVKVLSRSMGYLEKGRFTGDIVFHIQAQAKVLNPPSGSHLVCEVVGNNMMGMYVSYKAMMMEKDKKTKQTIKTKVDAIKIILPRDLHIGDEEFSKVQIGEKVHVEIKKSRFQVNDKYILSVGLFQGKVGSDYVAPEVEEQEDVVVEEKGPGNVAGELTRQFQQQEEESRAKQVAEAEEARKKADEESGFRIEDENVLPPLERNVNAALPVQAEAAVEATGPTPGYRTSGAFSELPYASGEQILFNATKFPAFKEFDNRFPAKFTLDGKEWPSVEHYYQAMKFPTLPEYQEEIRKAPTATAAAKMGKTKDPTKPIRADWKEQRETIMNKAIVAKFDQNPPLQKLLFDSYPRPIIFADANDAFWGYGRTKAGQNKLGRLLMEYRNMNVGMEAING
jgi:ribA/ribD-fused uncharacterized protein